MVITGFAVAIDKRFFYRNAIDIWLVVSKKSLVVSKKYCLAFASQNF